MSPPPPVREPHGGDDDEARFRTLFEGAYEDLLRFLERRVHPLAAQDVAADVFLVAWRRLDEVPRTLGDARAWLFTVAHHTLANARRGDARRANLHLRVGQALPASGAIDDASDAVAARVDLARAWALLSATDQEVLTLTGLDELTASQAATVLGISTTAVSVRLMRARRRLRRHLARGQRFHGDHRTPAAARTCLPESDPSPSTSTRPSGASR